MMLDEDDDLPVLTDVLRVRAPALREALDPRRAPRDETLPDPAAVKTDACDNEPHDEELVIGTTEADNEVQPHPRRERVAAEPHSEPFDEEDEAFLESFDGVATPEDLNAIEHLNEEETVTAAAVIAPAAFDSDAMAARVRDAVLDDLAQRIDTELDARLAQSVTAQLESALAGLQSGLRASLNDALRDVVRRAVDDEIARVRDPRDD